MQVNLDQVGFLAIVAILVIVCLIAGQVGAF